MTNSNRHTWVVFIVFVAVVVALIVSDESTAADVWIVTPAVGQHQTIVSPSGTHHLIINPPSHGYGYNAGQPGWNQYPNPVDSFLQNYRRGAEFNSWIRGGR